MKRGDAIWILLAALSLSAVLFALTDRRETSALENRSLTPFPRFSAQGFISGETQDQLEKALGDHLPFSEEIRGTVREAQAGVLRLQQDAIYGAFPALRDHYTQIAEGYYSYAGDAHRIVEKPAWDGTVPEGLRAFAERLKTLSGVHQAVYWIDNSRSISFDAPEETAGAREAVLGLFSGADKGVFSFDGYEEYCRLFYQTDHHWNADGSYRGYTEILELLRPGETPVPAAEEIVFPMVFNGSYARQTNRLCADEPFRIYRFELPKAAVTLNGRRGTYGRMDAYLKGRYSDEPLANHYSACYGGEYGEIVYDTGRTGNGTLLVFASSYSNPINGLLASHFDRTVIIDPRYYAQWAGTEPDPERLVREYGVTDLLLLGDTEFFLKDLAGEPAGDAEGGEQ